MQQSPHENMAGIQACTKHKAIEEVGNTSSAVLTELQAGRSGSAYSADQAPKRAGAHSALASNLPLSLHYSRANWNESWHL
ncbi:hypothetical protein N7491_000357 [Penicillium cf. griseofulvum]|nr:hypothetical protein N7491_000357 [Penicillium cf. griseofulvum]